MSIRIELAAGQNAFAGEALLRYWRTTRDAYRERRKDLHSRTAICLAMLIVLAAPSVESEPLVPFGLVEELATAPAGSGEALVHSRSAADRCLQATEKQ